MLALARINLTYCLYVRQALGNKYNESVRDYRRYLCSDPPPPDLLEVKTELDDMTEHHAAQQKSERARANEHPSSYYSKSNYYDFPDYNGGGGIGSKKSAATNGGAGGMWDDDDDDDANLYGKSAKSGAFPVCLLSVSSLYC